MYIMGHYPNIIRELKVSINNLIDTATKLREREALLRKKLRQARKELRDAKLVVKGRKKK